MYLLSFAPCECEETVRVCAFDINVNTFNAIAYL